MLSSRVVFESPVLDISQLPAGRFRLSVRVVELVAGERTGFHEHPGLALGAVRAGELIHVFEATPEHPRVYVPGDVVVEPAGQRHEGIAEGDEGVTILAVFFDPVSD